MPCSEQDYAYLRELVLTQSANFIDPSRNALFEDAADAHGKVGRRAPGPGGFVQMLRDKAAERICSAPLRKR